MMEFTALASQRETSSPTVLLPLLPRDEQGDGGMGFSPACATDTPHGPAKVAHHLLSPPMLLNLKGGF